MTSPIPRSPAATAQQFEDRHSTVITTLKPENRECPICGIPYGELYEHGNTENATQIDFNACHHVFGNVCLRKLINGNDPWCNRCPLCRAHWFHTVLDDEFSLITAAMLQFAQVESRESTARNPSYYNPESTNFTPLESRILRELLGDQGLIALQNSFTAEFPEAVQWLSRMEIPLDVLVRQEEELIRARTGSRWLTAFAQQEYGGTPPSQGRLSRLLQTLRSRRTAYWDRRNDPLRRTLYMRWQEQVARLNYLVKIRGLIKA